MKLYISLLILLLCSIQSYSKTKELILQDAYAYVSHEWVATAGNIWDPEFCGGKTVETPGWVGLGSNTSVPYCWGGFVNLTTFNSDIEAEKSGGDANTSSSYGAPDCATGVDCSGFLSQVWGTQRYTTSSLNQITTQLSGYDKLEATDAVNKAGSHVRMVYEVNPNGSITMVEAATGNSLVGGDGLYRVFNWTYSATDLVTMENDGYKPVRYGTVIEDPVSDNDACADAALLVSSDTPEWEYATVDGASASGLTIPTCDGWASPSAFDVWFQFKATSNEHTVTVNPSGELDAVLAVYSGGCSNLALVGCADVTGGGGLLTPFSATDYVAGQTYWVRVFDYGDSNTQPADGGFYISVSNPTPILTNENCSSAKKLHSFNTVQYENATVDGATASGMAIPDCSGYTSGGASDVWFSFVALTESHTVLVSPDGAGSSGLDAVVALYRDCKTSDLVECIDVSGGGGLQTDLSVSGLTVGHEYYIRVFDYGTVPPENGGFGIAITHEGDVSSCADLNEPNNSMWASTLLSAYSGSTYKMEACLSEGTSEDMDVYRIEVEAGNYDLSVQVKYIEQGVKYQLHFNDLYTDGVSESKSFGEKALTTDVYVLVYGGVGEYSLSLSLISEQPGENQTVLVDGGSATILGDQTIVGEIVLNAQPEGDYEFIHWLVNDEVYSTDSYVKIDHEIGNEYVPVFEKVTNIVELASEFNVYPQPASDYLTVSVSENAVKSNWLLYDIQGRVVLSGVVEDEVFEVSLNELRSGMYVLKLPSIEEQSVILVE